MRKLAVVDTIGRAASGQLASSKDTPFLELHVAVAARTAGHATRVEVGVLVKRDLESAMVVAENVATLTAVMTTDKIAKMPLAGRVVADSRLLIGLYEVRLALTMMRERIIGEDNAPSSADGRASQSVRGTGQGSKCYRSI